MDHPLSLNEIGMLETTDKSSLVNDYLRHYDRLLSPFRDQDINLLEIGVQRGASLRVWRRYFSKARIIGIDIDPACRARANEAAGVFVEIGSQDDPAFLKRVAAAHPPTVIIDDGSHISDHIVTSFKHLFPLLLPGGCYVMEDMFFMLVPRHADVHRGTLPYSAVDLLTALARGTQIGSYDGAVVGPDFYRIFGEIDRIEFFRQAAALWKKTTPPDVNEHIAYVEHLLDRAPDPFAWDRLFTYITMTKGPLEHAEAAAKRFFDGGGPPSRYHSCLSQIREMQGNLEGAIAEARLAVEFSHNKSGPSELSRLATLLARPGAS